MKITATEFYNNSINQRCSDNKKSVKNGKPQNFSGGGADMAFNILNKGFRLVDKNAMIQVSLIDLIATTIPRTIVDLKTSLAASLETFRRESSGLIVNCLLPGILVKGISETLPKSEILKGTDAANSWANENSIERLKEVYKNASKAGVKDTTKEYVNSAIKSLSGLDGTKWLKYSDKAQDEIFKSAVDDVTNAIEKKGSERNQLLKTARTKLVGITKTESVLNFNGEPCSNLEETLRDIADLGSKFNKVKEKTAKTLGKAPELLTQKELSMSIDKYSKSLTSFVNKKSFIGLGIVLALAVSLQSINRAITRKQFNAEGAPIYKDFGKQDTTQKMNKKEKKEFWGRKIAAAAGMFGLAILSMMKKPTKKMFQFSGIFPTLDQCRWVAAATFASRMLASEDDNELRETTVRDDVSFAGLYFLGDYVKKTVASNIEAISKTNFGKKLFGEEIILLNRRISHKKSKNLWEQFKNWVQKTDLKSANEVSSVKVRNLRNICRVADIAFSIVMLGIWLPSYNRKVTDKKIETAKQQELLRKSMFNSYLTIDDNSPSVFKNIAA